MSRNQLIIQLPFLSPDDWDTLLDVEETLIQAFSQNNVAMVDGHDVGQEKFNIFIFPKGAWAPVLERVYACLKAARCLAQGHYCQATQGKWASGCRLARRICRQV
jgi:hypothetical protein